MHCIFPGTAPDAPNASGAVVPKLEPAEMGNKKLRRDGKSLPREERKTISFMRQLDDMEHTKKAVKAAAPSIERSRVTNERVGGKRRLRDASDDARSLLAIAFTFKDSALNFFSFCPEC